MDIAGPPGTDPVAKNVRRLVTITEEATRRRGLGRDKERPPGLLTDNTGRIVPIRIFRDSSRDANDSTEDESEAEVFVFVRRVATRLTIHRGTSVHIEKALRKPGTPRQVFCELRFMDRLILAITAGARRTSN